MYLWHAINLSRLDREITPCLPANEPGHSCPAPIYYSQVSVMSRSNLLHSQGQGYGPRDKKSAENLHTFQTPINASRKSLAKSL